MPMALDRIQNIEETMRHGTQIYYEVNVSLNTFEPCRGLGNRSITVKTLLTVVHFPTGIIEGENWAAFY